MPIGAEVNAILVLLKVCNGTAWRAAPDICVHHKVLSKLSVINLKYTPETCLWDHEKEAGGCWGGGERAWKRKEPRLPRGWATMGAALGVHILPLQAPRGCCTAALPAAPSCQPRFLLTISDYQLWNIGGKLLFLRQNYLFCTCWYKSQHCGVKVFQAG